ncbi:MAG: hypothetical protein methR_P3923 [Methyloprofundus sp.]|nr:MAG: hypothetical protein methR_P3923 [Methyloprofundus sp.]
MKYSGLVFASLALSCSVSNAASDATFSGTTLDIPYVEYMDNIYGLQLTFDGATGKLVFAGATPLDAAPDSPKVKLEEDFSFSLTELLAGGETYAIDVAYAGDNNGRFEFDVTKFGVALHGKMFKGEQITNLGMLAPKSFSYAYGISDNGTTITGRSRNSSRKTVPVRFHFDHGHIQAISDLGGGRSQGQAANNGGMIAGFMNQETESGAPRIYNAFYAAADSAEAQNIGTLGDGVDSRAYGLNNNGMVVGWSASLADNTDHVAFTYDTTAGTLTGLGGDILGGQRSFAFAVNDANQITGVATTADGSALAFLYENGAAKSLGSLDNSGYSEGRSINDKGQVTGWSLTSEGKYAAFISDGDSMTAIPGLGGDAQGYDINTHGHVVGKAKDADGGNHAFVYKDGVLHDLYDMLPVGDKENWKELREAYSISDDGVVVGRGRYWTDKENGKNSSMAFRIQL